MRGQCAEAHVCKQAQLRTCAERPPLQRGSHQQCPRRRQTGAWFYGHRGGQSAAVLKMRTRLQNCRTRRTLCTAVFNFICKIRFCLCLPWSISRQRVKTAAESATGTLNRRTAAYTSRSCRTEPYTDGSFFQPCNQSL